MLEILEADPTAKFNQAIAVPTLFPCRAWASPRADIAAQARARRQAGRARLVPCLFWPIVPGPSGNLYSWGRVFVQWLLDA